MTRLIFLNRFFFPDHSATSQILGDLAFHLAESGAEVHVVTSRLRYDRPEILLPASERVRGVHVHRLQTTRFGRIGLPGRAADYASFYRAMRQHLLAFAQKDDVIVAKTDPPLLSIPAVHVAKRRGARIVNWLHDLYPEIAIELGVPMLKGPVGRGLAAMRDRSLRRADANVAIGDQMAARLRAAGVGSDRIHIIPNWTDDEQIVPVSPKDNPLRREWGLLDQFVVGYSGNLGRAHEFWTLLDAAEQLRNDPRVVFVFIGGGIQFDELRRAVRQRQLDRQFRFFPYQDRDRLKYSLSVPDVHWISLRPALDGLIFPSKLYGIAAAGRPVVTIAGKTGEIARLVEQHGCGIIIEPGDSVGLADTLRTLAADNPRCEAMGKRARAMLDAHFTRLQAFERWRAVIDGLG